MITAMIIDYTFRAMITQVCGDTGSQTQLHQLVIIHLQMNVRMHIFMPYLSIWSCVNTYVDDATNEWSLVNLPKMAAQVSNM